MMRNLIVRLLAVLLLSLPAAASEVSTWSTTSDNNNSTPPNGWPEGMNYSQVNNSAREMMGSIARWRDAFTVPASASINGAAGTSRFLIYRTGTVARWTILTDSAAETGGNAGSNLSFLSHNDAGTALTYTAIVARSTGIWAFTSTPTFPTASAGDNSTKGATTAWVRTHVASAASSGAYTPTVSANSNVFTLGPNFGYWMRTGNIVTVSVRIPTAPTAGALSYCSFEFTLPVASNITGIEQIAGTGSTSGGFAVDAMLVQGVVTNPGRVKVSWLSSNGGTGFAGVTYSYEVH